MKRIHLDFETFSEVDVRQVGSYRYATDPSTEALIMCWSYGDYDEIYTWTQGKKIPQHLIDKVEDPEWQFEAHNSSFERAIWEYVMVPQHDMPATVPSKWSCTATKAAAAGLPRSLDKALIAMRAPRNMLKDARGSRLIQIFSKPRKVPRKNEWKRTLPQDNPEAFQEFIEYCQQDVRGELWLSERLPELAPRWRELFILDTKMNERGIPVDTEIVRKASTVIGDLERNLKARIQRLSGGVAATQTKKFLELLQSRGVEVDSLKAQVLRDFMKEADDLDDRTRTLIELRLEAGKASTKKLASILKCVIEPDHVVRGAFLMNGAHTGRYAGKYIQPQNFIRGSLKELMQAVVFSLLEMEDAELFELLFDRPIDTISQCMRGFIRAPDGYRFVVVDYKAIEARILAWVAGHEEMLEAYHNGLDVYRIMAGMLFNKKPEVISSEERRIGKNLVLGCGYGLGGKNFVGYCAKESLHITEEFAVKAVKSYRAGAQPIVESWGDTERAAIAAVRNPGKAFTACKVTWAMDGRWLTAKLPSGRKLRYLDPKVEATEKFGKPALVLSFMTEFKGKLIRERTWGGTLIENVVQAIACDVMVEGMFNAEQHKYPVIGTVHDELLTLRKIGQGSHKELEKIACLPRPWMKGIPLESEGFECIRYRKG